MSLVNNWDDNQVLASLPPVDAARMTQFLSPVRLELRQRLEVSNRPIPKVYFPLCRIVSIVAVSTNHHHEVEVGLIGDEGMTGRRMAFTPCYGGAAAPLSLCSWLKTHDGTSRFATPEGAFCGRQEDLERATANARCRA